jgi:hypothetical protein
MKPKKNKTIFVCQLTNSLLKVFKCLPGPKYNSFQAVAESILLEEDPLVLSKKAQEIFRKLKFRQEPVIVSLPHVHIACRYLKVPTQVPEQIESIVSLQAARYLPYPEEELVTGYELIATDAQGYAYINLVIVHRDIIERMCKIFGVLKIKDLKIILSSYGLTSLYLENKSTVPLPVMLIDIDVDQVELAIIARQKLLFSRHLKWSSTGVDRNEILLNEIRKTERAYLDEVSKERVSRVVVMGNEADGVDLVNFLNQKAIASETRSEFYSYSKDFDFKTSPEVRPDCSFASLLGLSLGSFNESLNLLPKALKEEVKKASQTKKMTSLFFFVFGILILVSVGIHKSLDNKSRYLGYLKLQLNAIAKEAKPLEEIDKRLELLRERFQRKESGLELYYGLHQIVKTGITLTSFSYRKDSELVLRGQAKELNAILEFVSMLKKFPAFGSFDVKLRYASNKKTKAGDFIDFEIYAVKGKRKNE